MDSLGTNFIHLCHFSRISLAKLGLCIQPVFSIYLFLAMLPCSQISAITVFLLPIGMMENIQTEALVKKKTGTILLDLHDTSLYSLFFTIS